MTWAKALHFKSFVTDSMLWTHPFPFFFQKTVEGNRISSRRARKYLNPLTTNVYLIDHREGYRTGFWPFYNLVQIFSRALHFDSQDDGDFLTGLVQISDC